MYQIYVYKSLINANQGFSLTDTAKWQKVWQFVGDLTLINQYLTTFNAANKLIQATSSDTLPSKYLAGTVLKQIILSNNTTNPNTAINFSAGKYTFSDDSGIATSPALTKLLSATWVAGSNAGGLDTGTKTANTWYYCYAIYNPTTQVSDCIFSINNSSPTLPTGYTKYKYIGSIYNQNSDAILPFIQAGSWFRYKSLILNYNGNPAMTRTLYPVTVPSVTVMANIEYFADPNAGGDHYGLIASPLDNDDVPSITNNNANVEFIYENRTKKNFYILTNNGNIAGRWTGSTDISQRIWTRGYIDLAL